jgi:transcriptional regulator with XRE-family HTH domain
MVYKRIKNLREDTDLTQSALSKVLNCSQQVYSNYELGQRNIPTDILIKVSQFYNTSIDYLLNQTDEKNPYPKTKIKR